MAGRKIQYEIEVKDKSKKGFSGLTSKFKEIEKSTDKISSQIVKKFIGAEAIIRGLKKAFDFAVEGVKNYAKAIGDTQTMDKLSTSINTIQQQIGKELYPALVQLANFLSNNLGPALEFIHRTFLFIRGSISLVIESVHTLADWNLTLFSIITFNRDLQKVAWKQLGESTEGYADSIRDIGKAFGEIPKGEIVAKVNVKNVKVDTDKLLKDKLQKIEFKYEISMLGMSDARKTLAEIEKENEIHLEKIKAKKFKSAKEKNDALENLEKEHNKKVLDWMNDFDIKALDFQEKYLNMAVDLDSNNYETRIKLAKNKEEKLLLELEKFSRETDRLDEEIADAKIVIEKNSDKEIDEINTERINERLQTEYEASKLILESKKDSDGLLKLEAEKSYNDQMITLAGFLDEKRINGERFAELSKAAYTKYQNDLNQIEKDKLDERPEIAKEFEKRELALKGKSITLKIGENYDDFEKEFKKLDEKLQEGSISFEEFSKNVTTITKEYYRKNFQAIVEEVSSYVNAIGNTLSSALSVFKDFSDNQTERAMKDIDKWYNKEKEGLDNSIMSRKQYQKELDKLNEDKAKKERDEQKKAFIRNKLFAIAQANINGASAFMSALSATGNYYVNIALAIATAALTAVQIGIIAAQTFSKGGIVGGNSLTGDNVPVKVNSREMILTQQQQANLFALANGKSAYSKPTSVSINTTINGNVDEATLDKLDERDRRNQQAMIRILKQMKFNGTISNGVLV